MRQLPEGRIPGSFTHLMNIYVLGATVSPDVLLGSVVLWWLWKEGRSKRGRDGGEAGVLPWNSDSECVMMRSVVL